jgi:predicted esterase
LYFIGLRHPDIFTALAARQSTFRRSVVEGWFPDTARDMPVLIFHGTFDLVPVTADCKAAYQFLKDNGFREVELTTTPGGHVRHPEVAMDFFLKHWNRGPYVSASGIR